MPIEKDDGIDLIEVHTSKSELGAKDSIKVKRTTAPTENNIKLSSVSNSSSENILSETYRKEATLPPIPKPRKLKPLATLKSISDGGSTSQDVSEISSSLRYEFKTNKETKIKSKTYREQVKERFKNVKLQAGNTIHNASIKKVHGTTEKIIGLNKSVEAIMRETHEVNKFLVDYQLAHANVGEDGIISKAQIYNFFCEESNVLESEAESEQKENKNDLILTFVKPELISKTLRNSESEVFYSPNRLALTRSEKLQKSESRYLTEEGLYKCRMPKMPICHLNILESRLHNTDNVSWFSCEGDLDTLEQPYSSRSFRPVLDTENITTEYIGPTINGNLNYNLDTVSVIKENILQIHIFSLRFKHHPLFSIEHIFEQKLISLYDTYRQKVVANKLERISRRIDAIRYVINKTNGQSFQSGDHTKETKKYDEYCNELKYLRELQFSEGKEFRELLHLILETWKTIKNIREKNGYSNTKIKLNIRKEKKIYHLEKQKYDSEIDTICDEIKNEMEYQYNVKLSEYKKYMRDWKTTEQNNSSNKRPQKPTYNIDEGTIRKDIEKKFKESFKTPGEPVITFNICYDNEITEEVANVKETLRRNAVNTTKIYLKILCNKIEVCKSKTLFLNSAFVCNFDEALAIRLIKMPKYLEVEIHEHPHTFLKRKIGEIIINFDSKAHPVSHESEFTKEEIIHYKHDGVGSNISFKDFPTNYDIKCENEVFYTQGILNYNVHWEYLNIENDSAAKIDNSLVGDILKDNGSIDINKLEDWTKTLNIDPQHPKNFILFEYIKDYKNSISNQGNSLNDYFRCDPYIPELQFCNFNDIEDNIRIKFLELRNKNEPEFVGMIVPNRLKEIPENILSEFKKRKNEYYTGALLLEDYEENIYLKRIKGHKYLKQIQTKIFQKCRCLKNNLEYEDVVNEKAIRHFEVTIKIILQNICNWFRLAPKINQPLPILESTVEKLDVESLPAAFIKINVLHAVNLPVRCMKKNPAKLKLVKNDNNSTQTFVKVSYENLLFRTSTQEGPNPKWQEEFNIPLISANTDYLSPNALSGSIVIDVFDEVSSYTSSETFTVNEHWIGSIKVPISAICQNGKLEGLFKLKIPNVLFGYEQGVEKVISNSPRFGIPQLPTPNSSYIMMKIFVEPYIPKMQPNMEELPCSEPPYLRDHILAWNNQFNINFPHRKCNALAIDANCKTICITRFIKPLEPPQLNIDEFDATPEQCARYISLIPFTECNKVYDCLWLSTHQMLKIMVGSVIDHAVALVCYFLALNLEAWLILGYGIPQGTNAYVLLREYSQSTNEPIYFIYDSTTGEKHKVTDNFCPVQRIYCAVNESNIWANVQRSNDIANTRLEFGRRGDWLPLFDAQIMAPSSTIQTKLLHKFTDDPREIEIKLDKKLRRKIIKIRKTQRTVWNHHLSNIIKTTMPKFELSVSHGKQKFEILELSNYSSAYLMNGCLVSLPFQNIKSIWEVVKSTNVHAIENENAQFILAIHVHSYPNDVFAIWIMYASIIINK